MYYLFIISGTKKANKKTMTQMDIENAVTETQEYMENNYPSWNRSKGEQLARFFYDAVDKEGMIIPFDLTWQMAGYSRKDVAKDKLTGRKGGKLNLVEGTDYKLVRVSSENLIPETGETKNSGARHGGDRRTENIFMTPRAFGQFCLSAQTAEGTCLRDFVMFLTNCFKKVINNPKRKFDLNSSSVAKRLKVCESNKSFRQALQSAGCKGSDFGKASGLVNKSVTGKYAYERARELGKKSVNMRDEMHPAHMAITEAIEIIVAEDIGAGKHNDNALEHNKNIAFAFTNGAKEILHNLPLGQGVNLREIRKEQKQIENRPSNTLTNYFHRK